MPRRTELRFETLDDVMPDVEQLLAGHQTCGGWSLGQICGHLAAALRLTVEAPANPGEATRNQRAAAIHFFRAGRFPERLSFAHPSLEPGPGLDARSEAESLRIAIARFLECERPFPPHPQLGPLTREQWIRFHCMHAAHHLGFAVPTS